MAVAAAVAARDIDPKIGLEGLHVGTRRRRPGIDRSLRRSREVRILLRGGTSTAGCQHTGTCEQQSVADEITHGSDCRAHDTLLLANAIDGALGERGLHVVVA